MTVLSLISIGFIITDWTPSTIVVYAGIWILFGGAFTFILYPERSVWCLRISAGVLGVLMTLSMIDFVITQRHADGSFFQLRSPVVGFLVVGLPSFAFALWGGKSRIGRRLLEHGRAQREHPVSDESL